MNTCEFENLKTICILCGDTKICHHEKNEPIYKYSYNCEHNKRKYDCRECNGSSFCEHNKRKYNCRECDGSAFCKHNKYKQTCFDCGGSQTCNHGKQKQSCRECGGSAFCKHGKYKQSCFECGGSALCKTPLCETRGNPKYENYCVYCFINTFPEKEISRNYKTKELAVADYVKSTFEKFTWVNDKKVQDGCSRYRPDLLLDMATHIIIIEVDENKHTNYDCSCENKRLMSLSKDLQHRPIILIRFNPDSYKNEKGRLIKSCWKPNRFGILKISKQTEWEERLNSLKNQIEYWIENQSEKTLEIIELFY
jgi:hypothetical protein